MKDEYKTLLVERFANSLMVTIHRPEHRSSINSQFLEEMNRVLDFAENDSACRFIILQGKKGLFCTGMDFQELVELPEPSSSTASFKSEREEEFSIKYMSLLKRLTLTSEVVISLLDGQVLAGGVGIVTASDLVLSTNRTRFSLPEALWGLLPACVAPFLIRRIGFQKAYSLTLTTQTITALEAQTIGLVDELTENLPESLDRLQLLLSRITEETVRDLKSYFRKMWILTEEMESIAVSEINRLRIKPQVRSNIENFIKHKRLPWENIDKELD